MKMNANKLYKIKVKKSTALAANLNILANNKKYTL